MWDRGLKHPPADHTISPSSMYSIVPLPANILKGTLSQSNHLSEKSKVNVFYNRTKLEHNRMDGSVLRENISFSKDCDKYTVLFRQSLFLK